MSLLRDFVRESNRIEGIHREPTDAEMEAHHEVLDTPSANFCIQTLTDFVAVIAPGKLLRTKYGMDVRVGSHIAPRGGPQITRGLDDIIKLAVKFSSGPWEIHHQYETLHPFMDGNGRSGRALWLWMMQEHGQLDRALKLGFLHNWYYQTLDNIGRK